MIARIFPGQADNSFRGHWSAMVLLGLVALLKMLQGVMSVLNPRNTAMSADGIPLDRFDPAAAHEIVTMFALLGLMLVLVALPSFVVLIRYRSLVPLAFLYWLVIDAARRSVLFAYPSERSTAVPIGALVNYAILAVMLLGFVLSLWQRPTQQEPHA